MMDNVDITYKRIKKMYMRVKDNRIVISAPFFTSKKVIEKFILDNMDFINKQLKKQEILKANDVSMYDYITILNHKYQIMPSNTIVKKTENFIFLKNDGDIKLQIKKLFIEDFYKYMYQRTLFYFNKMNFNCSFPKITIKNVKSKWGSYNKSKHLILYSLELIFKNEFCQDYVIVHELAHILQFNHSKEFYKIVEEYFPLYKEAKRLLKNN